MASPSALDAARRMERDSEAWAKCDTPGCFAAVAKNLDCQSSGINRHENEHNNLEHSLFNIHLLSVIHEYGNEYVPL